LEKFRLAASPENVVTRFAPSPTGYLHIGGARTALFNWLYARHMGGKFLLRIEDTDRARSTQGAIDAILDGMRWLGLDWDGEEVYQFARAARHAEVAHQLLAAGHAYRCYATPEELYELREQQRAAKQPMRYDGRWRDRTDGPADAPHVIRLKAPRDGAVTIDDRVQGAVTVQNAELDDFVLLRSDGTPTYMLSVVVDDHDMGITHVIRGDDHLNNAFRQLALIHAMDWKEPVYAHVPLIHGQDGAKLSKRHGALGVEGYEEMGILSDALFNYLLRLGWGHGDDEIISRTQAKDWFDIDAVGRSPSRFDMKKLESINAHYLRSMAPEKVSEIQRPKVERAIGRPLTATEASANNSAIMLLQPRSTTINGIVDGVLFIFQPRPVVFDEGAAKLITPESIPLLVNARAALAAIQTWDADAVEAAVRNVAEQNDVGLGKVAQPLRAALTGRSTSPGIFDVLVLLGRDETLGRLDDCIAVQHG
jgi:glutamyl-tRNA synthetase